MISNLLSKPVGSKRTGKVVVVDSTYSDAHDYYRTLLGHSQGLWKNLEQPSSR